MKKAPNSELRTMNYELLKDDLHYFCPKIKKIVQIPQVTPKTEPFMNRFSAFLKTEPFMNRFLFQSKIRNLKSKILQSTISAPVLSAVPWLTARLAGRSNPADTKTAPIHKLFYRVNLPILTKKEKLNRF